MNTLSIVGKYLDQPKLVGKFAKAVPAGLAVGGAAFAINHLNKTPKTEKKKELIKSITVLTATIGSALLAARIRPLKIGKKILFKNFPDFAEKTDLKALAEKNTRLVDDFLKDNKVSEKAQELLQKAKTKILKFSEVKAIFNELHGQKEGKEFLNKLIPDPENIDASHIFGEIGRLSLMGFLPVAGGIAGGIAGDKLTEKDWKSRIPNKIKEGSYQFLANIFLCNIGAGAALAILEKAKIQSKSARAFGMVAGILAFGVLGGSAIANFIGKKFIDPAIERKQNHNFGHKHQHDILCKSTGKCSHSEGLYSERKPEALDIGLHVDDVATVAVLSGLKWIEPALPILYSISGYRAGIGYRNGDKKHMKPTDIGNPLSLDKNLPPVFKQLIK